MMAANGPRTVAAILVAAGSGQRLGAGIPKAFVELWGEPLYAHAARAIAESGGVDLLCVVVPPGSSEQVREVLVHPSVIGSMPLAVVAGGATRQASVSLGLRAVPESFGVVLVHDAARAITPAALIRAVGDAVLAGHAAVVPGIPVPDTVKRVGPDGCDVTGTVERGSLRLVQTPQGFRRDVLQAAHDDAVQHAHDEALAATDDAGLVERLGTAVHMIAGDRLAFKITDQHDLLIAKVFLEHT